MWLASLVSLVMLLLSTAIGADTPPGTTIINTAAASYQLGGTPVRQTASRTVVTEAAIRFLALNRGGQPMMVTTSSCTSPPAPTGAIGAPGNINTATGPAEVLLSPTAAYGSGDLIYIEVTDHWNNNPAVIQTLTVTLTSSTRPNDRITVLLTETGANSGSYIGTIRSASNTAADNNCVISGGANATLTATYAYQYQHDAGNPATTTVSAVAMINPFGTVFDSVSGAALDGAVVTLLDVASGRPATVLCNDGVQISPNPVTTGSTFTACGTTVALPPGTYRFPHIRAGNYLLSVRPPASYTFASTVTPAALAAAVATSLYTVVGTPGAGASYGTSFLIPPGVTSPRVDIPVDPRRTNLQIIKTAGKTVVGEGEYVPYSLSIRNMSTLLPALNVNIDDRLPRGFRYQTGSARLAAALLPDPVVSTDGRTLTFTISTIPAAGSVTLRYVALVTAGAPTGIAENVAVATGLVTSNVARANVTVREDLMRSRAILMGRVIIGGCNARKDGRTDGQIRTEGEGLPNARIVLEDGTAILTDQEGRWHADNIRPGTHVVQLDLDSIGAGFKVVTCHENSRFAGRNYSQFVNVRGGSLWRADFYVQRTTPAPPTQGRAGAQAQGSVATPNASAVNPNDKLVETLPYNADWLAAARPGVEWLHPQENFLPALPTIKVALKLVPGQRATLKLNGEVVSPLYFDGEQTNAARSVALGTWNGVHIQDGDNRVEMVVVDLAGKEVLRQTRNIHYAVTPDRVELVLAQSRLIADGKTRPVMALRFFDKDGHKMRRGFSGEFQLNSPYQSVNQLNALQQNPLGGAINGKPQYEIGPDGIALVELAPTTQSGIAVLNFRFGRDRAQEIRAWLEVGQRDWILVGFGQGTLGHKRLSGSMAALQGADADKQLFDADRIAFYAKGSIKGEYLLTMSYDSAKQQIDPASGLANLKQSINPSQYYTLYGDATTPYFDAASANKLYLKIERKQFYALFGDFDTGLTVTEFSRYSRTVTGLKSEYTGENFAYKAFATMTDQAYVKDEIAGDGTSGQYRLTRRNIVANSDKIRIETRDRFRSEVIVSSQMLTRYLDYDIDYVAGRLFFKQPINARDGSFNPIYIVAEYESGDPRDMTLTAGGRAAFKPAKSLEVGASLVHEGTEGARGNLAGLDATWQAGEKTKVVVEVANSKREVAGSAIDLNPVNTVKPTGSAWKVEVIHQTATLDAKLYAREQEAGFGLGQQAGSETGTRKIGGDARLMISPTSQGQFQAYRQESLGLVNARRDVVDARINEVFGNLTAYYGGRLASDHDGLGAARDSKQLLAGAGYTMLDKRITLRAAGEYGPENASADFPNRLNVGADYKLTEKTKLFVEQEFARGENFSANLLRAGLNTQPWTGASMAASLGDGSSLDSERLFANLGLVQRWQINEFWQADLGVDRVKTLSGGNPTPGSSPTPFAPINPTTFLPPLNANVPSAFGSTSGDYTATSVGLNYNNKVWSANGRFERRVSTTDNKTNLMLGLQRNLGDGRAAAGGFTYLDVESAVNPTRNINLNLSYASRPQERDWIWLSRLDYIDERTGGLIGKPADGTHSRKLVNNTNANWMARPDTQIALQYGAKFVRDSIDRESYRGYTDLIGMEIRHDLNRDWDIGASASMLHSWAAGAKSYGVGASLGYKLMENTWVVVGYNALGFTDRDFSGAAYRARGVYLTLRVKVDQDTFKLNDRRAGP